MSTTTPRSVEVLQECAELQLKKSQDYQNEASSVMQADYYPSGIKTIYEIMHAKMLRMRSLMEKSEAAASPGASFESLEDSARDLINYASFFVSYMEGCVPGQYNTNDMFNKIIPFVPEEPQEETADDRARRHCEEWLKSMSKGPTMSSTGGTNNG